jgi:hypothetical protein
MSMDVRLRARTRYIALRIAVLVFACAGPSPGQEASPGASAKPERSATKLKPTSHDLFLLRFAYVEKELKLSNDQRRAVDDARVAVRAALSAAAPDTAKIQAQINSSGLDDEGQAALRSRLLSESRKKQDTIKKAHDVALEALLKPAQRERLIQIGLWFDSLWSFERGDVLAALNLNARQAESLRATLHANKNELAEAMKPIATMNFSPDATPSEAEKQLYRESMRAGDVVQERGLEQVLRILNDRQRELFHRLRGRAIDLDALRASMTPNLWDAAARR